MNQVLARRIVEETKIYKALSKGLRDKPPINLKSLEEIMVRFSNMVIDFPEISEIDLNPLVVSRDGGIESLDARIILDTSFVASEREQCPHLVIAPYPRKYVTRWTMKDGTNVVIRPIRPEDEPAELEFVKRLSPETSRFRFFHIIKDMPHETLVRYCNIDYDKEMALVVELDQNIEGKGIQEEEKRKNKKRIVGVGRLISEVSRKAGEFSTVIGDDYQNKGLGTKLTQRLIEFAREKRLERIYGLILPDNEAMLKFCEKLGFKTRREEMGLVVAEMKLG